MSHSYLVSQRNHIADCTVEITDGAVRLAIFVQKLSKAVVGWEVLGSDSHADNVSNVGALLQYFVKVLPRVEIVAFRSLSMQ